MPNIYDELYRNPNYYGQAWPEVLDLFKGLPRSINILDVGCGQGRYAVALAEMGFAVTALDNSSVAINQLQMLIKIKHLKINALFGDVYGYGSYDDFDVVFCHLFFHFNPFEKNDELNLIRKILNQLKPGAILIIIGYKNDSDIHSLKSLLGEKMAIENTRLDHFKISNGVKKADCENFFSFFFRAKII
jgi:2-polyprenyl-3-methyl-5-hydroxy-6-metoxy-1,4-benzoquinol methylase